MKSSDFTAKGTSLRESTSFEPSCVKIDWRKVRKSQRLP